MKKYDVIIIGGGPSGLSVGSELSKLGNKIAIIEKNIVGKTNRSWLIPGNVISKLDKDLQKYAYNGVKRFLEYTPHLEIKWDTNPPWGNKKYKCYPFIDQAGLLNHFKNIILENNGELFENSICSDYIIKDTNVVVEIINKSYRKEKIEAKILIDASGYDSMIVKKENINRDNYYHWSVYGYDLEFDDTSKLKHPGNLGNMQIGDYMLWQAFKDSPIDKNTNLFQFRPIMEYEVLDEKRVFVFILFFSKNKVDKNTMKYIFNAILKNENSIKDFKNGKILKVRFGWYPSNEVSQKISKNRLAFIGDAGCWTIPAGWGMSFILNNYKNYAFKLNKLIKKDKLNKKNLDKIVSFNQRQKFEIVMDKLVLHFLSNAKPQLIDKFTQTIVDNFKGKTLETMFCLELEEKEVFKLFLVIIKKFTLKELFSIFNSKKDYFLVLKVIFYYILSFIFSIFTEDNLGFQFKK
ncbi:flavin-dependent dehydrogenase [Hypnocyclicus thermotrophus]|uniref:Flavin-dependent dehydrogenase n=1 Tax=Hypnocyclicus thermotrophus TaxID=1627895 RepID=A0AA46E0M2_9FUSO|nr:FAD-dependent monooxygenase [Hypnocyclicus thermotrophus]TDT72561.1 flavin-dependent dehydrogenase [Hypnocyclicus thermotrophus]